MLNWISEKLRINTVITFIIRNYNNILEIKKSTKQLNNKLSDVNINITTMLKDLAQMKKDLEKTNKEIEKIEKNTYRGML